MNTESLSNMALNAFKNSVYNKEDYGNDGFKFRGLVTYKAYNKTYTEILDVYLIVGGYVPQIRLDIHEKGEIITNEKFHLDFNPKYSNTTAFQFDKDAKKITIEGKNSPKLGNYEVIIEEYI